MKRVICVLLALVMCMCLFACGKDEKEEELKRKDEAQKMLDIVFYDHCDGGMFDYADHNVYYHGSDWRADGAFGAELIINADLDSENTKYDAMAAIVKVNDDLGLPDSLAEQIEDTSNPDLKYHEAKHGEYDITWRCTEYELYVKYDVKPMIEENSEE